MNPESRIPAGEISQSLNKTKEVLTKPVDVMMDLAFAFLGVKTE